MTPLLLLLVAGVELSWPATDCPTEAEVLTQLGALLPGPTADVRIETATRAGNLIELTFTAGERTIRRGVRLEGPCDRRAATVAAVIERVVIAPQTVPISDASIPAPPPPPTATATVSRTPELAPPFTPEVVLARPRPATTATAGDGRPTGWLMIGARGGVGDDGRARVGVEAEGAFRLAERFSAAVRGAYRLPVTTDVGPGDVRIDEGFIEASVIYRAIAELHLEAGLFAQIAVARSRGIAVTGRETRFNPGFGLAVRYLVGVGPVAVHVGARGLIPFRSQRFLVSGAEVARLPRVHLELAVGLAYAF